MDQREGHKWKSQIDGGKNWNPNLYNTIWFAEIRKGKLSIKEVTFKRKVNSDN